ncbi:hypothetical protein [Erwinia amylovora]
MASCANSICPGRSAVSAVSYTHLDVYKSQLQCGIKPKGEVKDLADALPWICLLYTSRCV